ncbi:hypothetical protein SDC9_195163 [bioreactor metagenome]|uniref:Uncharacterized protein n=1 Tax=bioreactor metagenome TaxID=1076179 RepID=A0A645I8W7_9ZZZZ
MTRSGQAHARHPGPEDDSGVDFAIGLTAR